MDNHLKNKIKKSLVCWTANKGALFWTGLEARRSEATPTLLCRLHQGWVPTEGNRKPKKELTVCECMYVCMCESGISIKRYHL